ncbi:heme peroxidase domain-containing protein [Ditylenchus destructor]|uniref:Heme peroxidase domain-containing protein n=1 Tax=Ditylenchus destructor TaxID=166010 RepID=A0AAD4MPK7_9BILA|nr:heme peroxidase domain-containing protein [Ditylenchus destructor]
MRPALFNGYIQPLAEITSFRRRERLSELKFNQFCTKNFCPKCSNPVLTNYDYDPQVDPTISNVFTTSAYRLGHGMLRVGHLRKPVQGLWKAVVQYPRPIQIRRLCIQIQLSCGILVWIS